MSTNDVGVHMKMINPNDPFEFDELGNPITDNCPDWDFEDEDSDFDFYEEESYDGDD